jgi:class 3 adenylate cyclase
VQFDKNVTRRLAAVLVADVVGYSRLMGADEEGTHQRLKAHLAELAYPKIEEYRGRVVKSTGDGFLAEFPSVVDAVRCAVEIQRGMAERNAGIAAGERIDFRIGINLGDVIAEPEDIFGDDVNIAARLEGLAEPGGICISGTVRERIGYRLPYAFEDIGEQKVRNIAQPVHVYRVSLEARAKAAESGSKVTPSKRARPSLSISHLPIVVILFSLFSGGFGFFVYWIIFGAAPNIPPVDEWRNVPAAIDAFAPSDAKLAYSQLTKQLKDLPDQIETFREKITIGGDQRTNEALISRINKLQHEIDIATAQLPYILDGVVENLHRQLLTGKIIAKGYDQHQKGWVYISPSEWRYLTLYLNGDNSEAGGGLNGQTHLSWLLIGKPVSSKTLP